MIWAQDMDSVLVAGWAAGLPSTQIALMVGQGITSSAVRGRARDLNLPMRAEQMVWAGKYKGRPPPIYGAKPLPNLSKLGPESDPTPLVDRTRRQCAFPVGDNGEDMLCCGGPIPADARRPYCAHHLKKTAQAVRHAA